MRSLLRMQDLASPGCWSPSYSSSLNREVGSRGQGIAVHRGRRKTMEEEEARNSTSTLLSSLFSDEDEQQVRRYRQSVNCAGRDSESPVRGLSSIPYI